MSWLSMMVLCVLLRNRLSNSCTEKMALRQSTLRTWKSTWWIIIMISLKAMHASDLRIRVPTRFREFFQTLWTLRSLSKLQTMLSWRCVLIMSLTSSSKIEKTWDISFSISRAPMISISLSIFPESFGTQKSSSRSSTTQWQTCTLTMCSIHWKASLMKSLLSLASRSEKTNFFFRPERIPLGSSIFTWGQCLTLSQWFRRRDSLSMPLIGWLVKSSLASTKLSPTPERWWDQSLLNQSVSQQLRWP